MPRSDSTPTSPTASALRAGVDRRAFLRAAGLGGLGLSGAAALAACGGGSSGSGSSSGSSAKDFGDIAVQLSWIKNIEFAGEYQADDKGYYTKAGFSKVTLLAGGAAGTSAEAAVAGGKAFAGLSSPIATATAILKGADLVTVATTYQKNPFCIVSLASNPITSPKDMIGRKIGIQAGANDTIFGALCKANDIDVTKINKVPVQYDPSVLVQGQVEGFMAYITNEPILLEAEGTKVATFLFADNGLPLANETIVVSGDTVKNDGAKLRAFLKAEVQGWTDALNDPDGAAKLTVTSAKYGKSQKLDLAEQTKEINAQAQLIVTADTVKNGIFTLSDDFIAENIKSLTNAGITISADKLFDTSFIDAVYKADPSLVGGPTATPSASS